MGRRRGIAGGPSGLVLVDKPAGISSAAVVARVRRVLGGVKAGHTGTLDPFATGLLPLCLGEGTKLATYLTDADKSYEGVIRLGVSTDTYDRTGTVTSTAPVPAVDAATLARIAAEMTGNVMQVPPSFSAIKKDGRPMYELARRGEAPEMEARPVRVDRVEFGDLGGGLVSVSVDCSKGFYVRSLARDLGESLGCGAVLDELQRTRVGRLRIEDATPLAAIEAEGGADLVLAALIRPDLAPAHLSRFEIGAREAADLRLGRQDALHRIPAGSPGEKVILVAGEDLVAVAACDRKFWVLERVFGAPASSAPCPPAGIVYPPPVSKMEEEERNEANRRD